MRTYTGIQAMRGVAALAVVCGHALTMRFGMGFEPASAMNALFLLQGGVDIFFVISGFIITMSSIEAARAGRRGAIEFAAKRLVRIFPVYWLVLLAAIISARFIDVFPKGPGFTYAIDAGYIFALKTDNWYVAPAWSLCYELYFYAAVTLFIAIVPRQLSLLLLTTIATVVVCDVAGISMSIYSQPLVLEFGLGMLIAFVVRHNLAFPITPFTATVLAAGFFVLGWYLICSGIDGSGSRMLTYGFGAAFLIYAVVSAEQHGARFPRWLQFLGAISYSLYLTHHLLMTWLSVSTNIPAIPGALQIVGWIVLAISLATVCYYAIERPTMRFSRSLIHHWFKHSSKASTPFAQPHILRQHEIHELHIRGCRGALWSGHAEIDRVSRRQVGGNE